MSTFTLGISYLTTSNLPWFMDLTFQVPMQYCSLQHQTLLLSPVPSTTGCCFSFVSIPSFFLELFLHWSPVAYWVPTDLGSSSFSVLFAFSYCSWGSQGKSTEVFCHSLLQWTTFCQTSPPWPVHLGWPHMAWLSFIELDKLWSMWSDWLVFYDHVFSLSALWCLLLVPTVLLGFLLPSMSGISSQPPLLTLDVGYLLSATSALHSHCSFKTHIYLVAVYFVYFHITPYLFYLWGCSVHGVKNQCLPFFTCPSFHLKRGFMET